MKNSGLAILLNFLRQMSFSSAVFSIFFITFKGFDIGTLAIYLTICKLSQTILEIPSGVFADKYGRKRSLQLSRGLAVAQILLLILGPNVPFMLIAAVIEGLCNALYSDSDTSLVYDGMKKVGRTDLYPKFIAMYNGIGYVGYAVASIIGALVAAHAPIVITLWMRLPILLLHLYISKQLIDKVSEIAPKRSPSLRHLKESWIFVIGNRNIVKVIYFSATIYAYNLLVWDYWQVYGMGIALPTVVFGLVAAVFAFAEGFPQFISYKYLKTKNFSRLFVVLIGATAALGLGAAVLHNQVGFVMLILSIVVTGFSFPVSAAIIQKHADTKHRTTVASFSTLFGMLTYSVFSLFFGAIAQAESIFVAFGFSSVVTLAALAFYIFMHVIRPYLHKHGKLMRLMHIPEGILDADEDRHRGAYKHRNGWRR